LQSTYEDHTLKLIAETPEEKDFLTQILINGAFSIDVIFDLDTRAQKLTIQPRKYLR